MHFYTTNWSEIFNKLRIIHIFVRCEHGWWHSCHFPQVQVSSLMLIVSCISLPKPNVRGVLYWNIMPSRSNRDIECDLEVFISTSISTRIFGGHNTSQLKIFNVFSTLHKICITLKKDCLYYSRCHNLFLDSFPKFTFFLSK